MLIEQCLCGSTEYLIGRRRTGTELLELGRCGCGTEWLRTNDTTASVADYYASGTYHVDEHRHAQLVNYRDRYESDRAAAKKRLSTYASVLGEWWDARQPLALLDVGAANGAFVDEANTGEGIRACGVEPDPAFRRPGLIFTGDVTAARGDFDLITYHDVLEHVPEPRAELARAVRSLRPNGVLVVDVPDVHVQAGAKHYKREHLWYFTLRTLVDTVRAVGLEARAIDFPIPGKMVVYGWLAAS